MDAFVPRTRIHWVVPPARGGLGAIEAALVAGLTGIGVPPGPAVSAVLTYRLATYWLPVIPGWAAWRLLQDKTTYDVPSPAASSRSSEGPLERLTGLQRGRDAAGRHTLCYITQTPGGIRK